MVDDELIENIKQAHSVYLTYNENRVPFEDDKLALVILNNTPNGLMQLGYKRVLTRSQIGENLLETYRIERA